MKNKSKKNKMIKLISPYNGNVFNIELKGDEESLRDLLSIILNIPSKSIKGIKDNYNNYYTLSSALKSQNINKGPNNIFSVIINNETNNINKNIISSDFNIYNRNKNDNYMNPNLFNNIYFKANNYINNSDIYYNNIRINNIKNYGYQHQYQKIGQYSNYFRQYNKEAYYNLIIFLYKNKYIGKNNYYKLKKFIEVDNSDVMEILKPFIEFDNNYDKLINNLFPILNLDLSISGNSFIKKNSLNKNEDDKNIILLNSLKDNFTKDNLKKLNYLLLIENMSILNLFETYYKTGNKNNLIDGLYSLLKRVSKVDLNKSNNIMGNILKERKSKSHDYKIIKKNSNNNTNSESDNSKKNKKKKLNQELLQNITDKIIKYGNKFSKDINYLIKYELNTISIEDKADLFKNKFEINIDKKNKIKELSETNKKNIKKYYNKYIKKNIYKFLDEEEKDIYENIIQTPNSQEFNDIIKMYSDLIKDDKMKNKMELLRNKIINYLKDLKQIIEEKSKTSENKNEKESDSETNKEKSASNKLVFNDDEEEEEEDDDQSKKEEEKESSSDSSTVVKEEDNESENYDKAEEESGVSITKAQRGKKN